MIVQSKSRHGNQLQEMSIVYSSSLFTEEENRKKNLRRQQKESRGMRQLNR